jgi:hypothetical protein
MTAHDLRGLFLQVAFKAQQTDAKKIPFGMHVLGHERPASTACYEQYRVTGLESLNLQVDYKQEYFFL